MEDLAKRYGLVIDTSTVKNTTAEEVEQMFAELDEDLKDESNFTAESCREALREYRAEQEKFRQEHGDEAWLESLKVDEYDDIEYQRKNSCVRC